MGCHIIHNACCEAGLKITMRSDCPDVGDGEALNHELTWMHGDTHGYRTFDSTSQSSTRKLFTTRQRCEKDKKKLQLRYRRSERKRTEELESLASLCSSTDDLAQGWTSLRRTSEQLAKQPAEMGRRPLQEWQRLLSIAPAWYTAATVLSATGHKP